MQSDSLHMNPLQKHAPHSLGRVLVLGLGKSGQAALRYCLDLLGTRIQALTVVAGRDDTSVAFVQNNALQEVTVLFECDRVEGTYDLGIASPGIPEFSSLYLSAQTACSELIGEVEFAWRESAQEALWVAITGTNGKTTTTALTAHLLQASGLRAQAVGNIGDTCLEAVRKGKTDIYVAEVSSYQLASTCLFAPDVAILLNITPDHLKWHTSFEKYIEAKKKIFANRGSSLAEAYENADETSGDRSSTTATPNDRRTRTQRVAILDATDERVRDIIKEMKAQPKSERGFEYIPLGTSRGLETSMIEACGSDNAACLREGMFCVEFAQEQFDFGEADALQIKGEHNKANALAALSATVALGADTQLVRESLSFFQPLEHRVEPCGAIGGVWYYNDSKATNSDAVIKALSAFEDQKLTLLLGGTDKGTDLSDLVEEVENKASRVVCFGEAGPRFYKAFEKTANDGPQKDLSIALVKTMEDAFEWAYQQAEPGNIVLLSPACASFDEFSSFEHRGETFKKLVSQKVREKDRLE